MTDKNQTPAIPTEVVKGTDLSALVDSYQTLEGDEKQAYVNHFRHEAKRNSNPVFRDFASYLLHYGFHTNVRE